MHCTSRSCVSHPIELVRSGWQLSTVHDGRLSAARNMEGWRGRGADGCEHSRVYNAWEVMWGRSGVKREDSGAQ